MPPPAQTALLLLTRWLSPIAELRAGEGGTALLLFLYSFLAMTSYNIVKPVTRSQFISSLGADNLPWVQFAAGMVIGVLMQGYTKAHRRGAAALDHPGHAGRHDRAASAPSGCSSPRSAPSGCRSGSTSTA